MTLTVSLPAPRNRVRVDTLIVSDLFRHDGAVYMVAQEADPDVGERFVRTVRLCHPMIAQSVAIQFDTSDLVERLYGDLAVRDSACVAPTFASVGLTPDEATLIRNGSKIQAIKAVRARTGRDLRVAKALVDACAPFCE